MRVRVHVHVAACACQCVRMQVRWCLQSRCQRGCQRESMRGTRPPPHAAKQKVCVGQAQTYVSFSWQNWEMGEISAPRWNPESVSVRGCSSHRTLVCPSCVHVTHGGARAYASRPSSTGRALQLRRVCAPARKKGSYASGGSLPRKGQTTFIGAAAEPGEERQSTSIEVSLPGEGGQLHFG